MTFDEMFAVDCAVRDALGVRPHESIDEAALRLLTAARGNPAWQVAAAVRGRGEPWRRMRKASKAAKRLARRAQR